MRANWMVVIPIALGVAACALSTRTTSPASPSAARDPSSEARAALMQIERDIGVANVKHDKAYFQAIEAEEFIFTSPTGSLTTKAEDLAGMDAPTGDWALLSYDADDMTVHVYGNTGVVIGKTTTKARNAKTGEERTSQSRFTDTFVRRDGRWQLVAGHASRIPAKPAG